MNYRFFRVCLAALLALPLLLASGEHRASAHDTDSSPAPTLTLVAEKHPGLQTITADLGESVSFKATWTGKLQKGEYLAIVTVGSHKLAGGPKAAAHCPGIDSYDTPTTKQYVAEVYTRQRVIKKSHAITVDWKDLTIELDVLSDVAGTLSQVPNVDPPKYSQLEGIPIALNVRFPEGAATSWKTVQIVDTAPNKVLHSFDPENGKKYVSHVSTADILDHEYVAKAFDATDKDPVKLSKTATVSPRIWKVEVDVSGSNGSSSGDLSVNLGDQVQVTAVIKEPDAQSLAQYVNIQIVSNYNNDKPKTEKDCPHAWTCSVPETRSSEEAVPFTAAVYVTDPEGKDEDAGISEERTVTWTGPPPNANDYGIQYKITGGSGDCSPAPPQGFSGCFPGPNGDVVLTAQVSFQGKPMTEQLPFGYSIRWIQNHDQVDIPDCPDRAPTCTVTVHGPASGSTDFQATMGSKSDPSFVYWTLTLTATWEARPKQLIRPV